MTNQPVTSFDSPGGLLPARPGGLTPIDKVSKALAEANTIPEIKLVHDEIDAIIPALKQLVKEGKATFEQLFPMLIAKLKAERKAGGMLAEIPRSEGGRPSNNSSQCDELLYTQAKCARK